jgi:type II secretory pathway component PulF
MNQPQLQLADRLALCQQVARLARARLPISGELAKHIRTHSRLHPAAASIDEQLQAGKSLAQAMANDCSRDSRILAACIEAGECSGHLERTLEAWAGMHLANGRSAKALRAAMLYPLLLIAITLGSLGYVIWTLIPEYKSTYALFGHSLPLWLDLLTRVRANVGWLLAVLAFLALAPLVIWAFRKRQFDPLGLPRDRVRRLRLQALASDLASVMIESSVPLVQLVPLSVAATGADAKYSSEAFGKLQKRAMIEPLGKESTLLLTSLFVGIMDRREASQHLAALGTHLRHHGDQVAERQVRWLPMLIALVVGLLTILTYVFLIYLPWVLLLKQMILPPSLDH